MREGRGLVLPDSIGISERGEEEGGENSETANDRQMDKQPGP